MANDSEPTSDPHRPHEGVGSTPDSSAKTYRYLRLGISLLPVFLGAALLVNIAFQGDGGCHDSISAYYYTPVRNVFVGTLTAMGLGLVAIQGRFIEDLLLDLAGILAVVVALVPTPLDTPTTCTGAPVADVYAEVANGVSALVIVLLAALVLAWVVILSSKDDFRRRRIRGLAVVSGLFVIFVAWFATLRSDTHRDWFLHNAHFVSAGAMFGLIVVVVIVNAITVPRQLINPQGFRRETYRRIYAVLAAVMTGVLLFALWCLYYTSRHDHRDPFDHWLFWVELALLGCFSVFWALQTAQYWNDEEDVTAPLTPAT